MQTEPQSRPEPRVLPPARVSVYAVQPRDLRPVESLTGRLAPVRRAGLRFEVPGRVSARVVEPGLGVEAGEVLLRLEDGDYRDAVAEAEARLELDREQRGRDQRLLELARRSRELQAQEVARLERLQADSLAAQSRLDEARQRLVQLEGEQARLAHDVDAAGARLQLRRAALARARRNLGRTRLTAPFDGVINKVEVQVGDYVSSSQAAVELIQVDELELRVELRAAAAAAQRLGDRVAVEVDGQSVQGTITALQRDADPTTFTYPMRVRVPGAVALPGTPARVHLSLPRLRDVLAVPATALVHENGAAYVLVVNDQRLHRTPVQLGPRVEEWRVVRGGLDRGQRVVRRDAAALSDGQRVVVRDAAPPAAPGTAPPARGPSPGS